jgi:hypothetical protein
MVFNVSSDREDDVDKVYLTFDQNRLVGCFFFLYNTRKRCYCFNPLLHKKEQDQEAISSRFSPPSSFIATYCFSHVEHRACRSILLYLSRY